MSENINFDEIKYLTIENLDDFGELFELDGKLYRGINPGNEHFALELFNSGFIPELVEKNLFVNSKPVEKKLGKYNLVIEHEKIEPVIYPHEFTFTMLKDAALLILNIAKICEKRGFSMKDCHAWNSLFYKNKPVYVDLGSFLIKKENESFSFPCQDFLESYYFPLLMWKDGLEYSVKYSLLYNSRYPALEFYLYKYKILRLISGQFLITMLKVKNILRSIHYMDKQKFEDKLTPKGKFLLNIGKMARWLILNSGIFRLNFDKLIYAITKLDKPKMITDWENYYGEEAEVTDRFRKILNYTKTVCKDATTAISFGSNQGFFENLLLEQTQLGRVICQDLDSKALDMGYNKYGKNRAGGKDIYFVNYDACLPIQHPYMKLHYERFKSDIVYALAITHHLMLRGGFRLGFIFNEFSKYSNKYILVEFMPLGLWIPGANVSVPAWFTVEYFRKEFKKYFELILEEELEKNRIIFIGRKR